MSMSSTIRILAFAGSARRDSLNRKFLAVAADACREAGAEVTLLDLNDYEMPLYHGDLEAESGVPAAAARLIPLIQQHHALLIASPEYNSLITPLLKNTIDWCTRGDVDPFPGRVAAVLSASPGALGGINSQRLAQQLLLHLGCHVVPGHTILPRAHEAFAADGSLINDRARQAVQTLAADLVTVARQFV